MEVMQDFNLFKPSTLDEAIAHADKNKNARFLAGGTDLITNLRRGIGEAQSLIDLSNIKEMNAISIDSHKIRLGAGVKLVELAQHQDLVKTHNVITQAAEAVAGPTHREMASIGGNLCLDTRCIYYNQSHWWRKSNDFCLKYKGDICHVAPKSKKCFAAFSGDLAPALLLYDAELELIGPKGRRTITLDALYADDGAAHLTLGEGEFIIAVSLPAQKFQHAAYEKIRMREAIDFPLAGVAIGLERKGDVLKKLTIAFTGTNSRPITISGLDELLGTKFDDDLLTGIQKLATKQIKPMKSTSSPSTYRRAVAIKMALSLIERLWSEAV